MGSLNMIKRDGSQTSMIIEKRYKVGEATLNYAEGVKAGPPLVLTHGLTDRWQYYLPIIPFLTMRWHVYALDCARIIYCINQNSFPSGYLFGVS